MGWLISKGDITSNIITTQIDGTAGLTVDGHSISGQRAGLELAPPSPGNEYTGGTTIENDATVYVGSASTTWYGPLGSISNELTINTGGALDLGGSDITVGGLSGDSSAVVGTSSDNGSTVTLCIDNGPGSSSSFAGTIQDAAAGDPAASPFPWYYWNPGTGTYFVPGYYDYGESDPVALDIQGAGVQSLTGDNTYSGGTTIDGGTLEVCSGMAIGTAASGDNIVIPTSGILKAGGNLTLPQSIHMIRGRMPR